MSTIRITTAVLLGFLGFSSCKKEVTQVVNQAFSASYNIKTTDWVAADQGLSYSVSLTVNELDNTILDDGGVIVYLSFDNGISYVAIPQEFGGVSYGAVHQNKTLYLDFHNIDGSAPQLPTVTVIAKVVIVDAQHLP